MVVRVGRAIASLFTLWLRAGLSKLSLGRIIYCLKKKKNNLALCMKICKCQVYGMPGAQPSLLWLALK